HELVAGVIVLSPHARSSASDPGVKERGKLVTEAQARAALLTRLQAQAKPMKNVLLACYPDGPKKDGPPGWKISDKAQITVLFYRDHHILTNHAFADGQMKAEDVDAFLTEVDDI